MKIFLSNTNLSGYYGILESVYWKPTIIWHIDKIRVMKPIQTEKQRYQTFKIWGRSQRYAYYISSGCGYQVQARFVWNLLRDDLAQDRNENKHYFSAKRMDRKRRKKGCFLGVRECQAYVEPCVFGEGEGYYDDVEELSFGMMFHGFDYPSETGIEEFAFQILGACYEVGVGVYKT